MLAATHRRLATASSRGSLIGPRTEALLNVVLLPYVLAVTVGSTVRRWLARHRRLSAEPAYRIAGSVEPLRDVARFAARAEVEAESCSPRFGWSSLDFQMQYAPDTIASTLDLIPRFAGKLASLPAPFEPVEFESLDGTRLAAQVAVRDDRPRPGLVVAHGTFGAGAQPLYADAAIEAYEEWGFNVIAVDLRGWGRSATLADTVITCGWLESEDVLAAARYLKEHSRTTTCGAVGYSLGGGSAMNAAAHELAPELLDGGVLSESGFSDVRTVVEHLAESPGALNPSYLAYWIFRLGFAIKFRASGVRGQRIGSYASDIVARKFGVDVDELWRRASVIARVDEIKVPALQLHAEDDRVVPVEHARALESAARENSLVGVCVRPRGAHCAFARVWGGWRSDLARTFFASVAGVRLEKAE